MSEFSATKFICLAIIAIVVAMIIYTFYNLEPFHYYKIHDSWVKPQFDLPSALFMAELSDMAYYVDINQQVIFDFMEKHNLDFGPSNMVTNLNTDTSFIYCTDSDNRDLYIAFRGTELTVDNIKSDLYETLVPFAPLPSLPVLISEGFLNAWMTTIRDQVYQIIQNIQPERLFITGHSLGGALASLCAFDITMTRPGGFASRRGFDMTVYTFASPRVGDAGFATMFKNNIPRSYRVQNLWDPIPRFPTTYQDYVHVPEEILIYKGQECIKNAKIPDNWPYDPKEHSLEGAYIPYLKSLIASGAICENTLPLMTSPKLLPYYYHM